jgi:hypothetical protein
MTQTTIFDQKRQAADGRREALAWLARRLNWERRLGELRPADAKDAPTKQAA